MSEEEKNKNQRVSKEKVSGIDSIQEEALKNKLINLSVCKIIMSEKALKFNNIKINKKEFHKSNQAIDLDSIITDKIAVSDKLRHIEEG